MPACPPRLTEHVRLWRDPNGIGPTEYYRDNAVEICLRCPADIADCEAMTDSPTEIRHRPHPPRCPLAFAIYFWVEIPQAESLGNILEPDNPLSLLWYQRAIKQIRDRDTFIQMMQNRRLKKEAEK